MKKFLVSALLIIAMFIMQICVCPTIKAEAYTSEYTWQTVSLGYGQSEWVCYKDGQKVHGWNFINGNWYYLYDGNGYMAHNTFVNGYYVNNDGAWTKDIPYAIQRVIDTVQHPGQIYSCGDSYNPDSIGITPNCNFKEQCKYGWNAPDLNGTIVSINYSEYFVADDGTVFKAPHQAYDTIYQYDQNGNVVKEYPYVGNK